MTNILGGFAYDSPPPKAQPSHRNSEYSGVMQLLIWNEEYFLERLNEEEKILFEKYIDAQDGLNRLTAVGNLIYSCKLGVVMMAGVFVGIDDLFQYGGNCWYLKTFSAT